MVASPCYISCDETQLDAQDFLFSRQVLRNAYLGSEHPITEKKVSFQAPMWENLQREVLAEEKFRETSARHRLESDLQSGIVAVPCRPILSQPRVDCCRC